MPTDALRRHAKQQQAQQAPGRQLRWCQATNEIFRNVVGSRQQASNHQEEAVAVNAPAGVVSRSSKRLREPTEATTAAADDTADGTQDAITDSLEPEGKRTRLGRAAKAQAVAKPMDADANDMHHTRMKISGWFLVDAMRSVSPQEEQQE
jgi:hypothetical protein